MTRTRASFWRLRYARWHRRRNQQPGYTLLIPVPGDLPVFLDLALAVCRTQDAAARVATFVIPDHTASDEVRQRVAQAQASWRGPLELLELPLLDRLVLPRLGDPGRNHGAQIIKGVGSTSSSHVLLHDADLFLLDAEVHDDLYDASVHRELDVVGISPPWDPWYTDHGFHLVATWEQCSRVDWFRSFPPHRHLGHDSVELGESHTFDTTFWPQFHTPAQRVAVADGAEERVVHFNYVISSYRRFQRSSGPFHDDSFRLLLIRVFIELFSPDSTSYGLPDLDGFARGLRSDAAGDTRVRYLPGDSAAYASMRDRLEAMLRGPWADAEGAARAQQLLEPFDEAYLNRQNDMAQ